MKVVLQRVTEASVSIDKKVVAQIKGGLLILLGIENEDSIEDINWLTNKIINLRIFSDSSGKTNNSVIDVNGDIILVSQFTLHASTKKGNRPSYSKAAKPEIAIPLYHKFISSLEGVFKKEIQTGEFGADMQVSLINDGPVTILIDSKDKI